MSVGEAGGGFDSVDRSPKQQQLWNGIRASPDHGILIEPAAQLASRALVDAEREVAQLPGPSAGRIACPLNDVEAHCPETLAQPGMGGLVGVSSLGLPNGLNAVMNTPQACPVFL